jgi:hypothetical protein
LFQRTSNPKILQKWPRLSKKGTSGQFYLDVAGPAWELYQKWQIHPRFKGTGLRAIERDSRGDIVQVPDGIIFPIIAALSAFALKRRGKWVLVPPDLDIDLINTAKTLYQQVASSNPSTMGRSRACYSQLYQITSIYKRLMPR